MTPRSTLEIFGSLESAIMPIVWQRGNVTVREVYAELVGQRALAYTTVLTTMVRLYEKGLLVRSAQGRGDGPGGRGRTYCYAPRYSRRQFAALALEQITRELLDGDRSELARLVSDSSAPSA